MWIYNKVVYDRTGKTNLNHTPFFFFFTKSWKRNIIYNFHMCGTYSCLKQKTLTVSTKIMQYNYNGWCALWEKFLHKRIFYLNFAISRLYLFLCIYKIWLYVYIFFIPAFLGNSFSNRGEQDEMWFETNINYSQGYIYICI